MNHPQSPQPQDPDRRVSLRLQDAKTFPLVEGILEIEEGQYWPVTIDNLSLEGALLEMPGWRTTLLALGREIHLKLTLEEKIVWATGVIQHSQPGSAISPKTGKVGVRFQKLQTKEGKPSNQILGEMVRALDRYNLRRRANLHLSEG